MKANRIVKFSMYLFVLLLLCFTSDLQNEWILSRWGSLIINFSNYLKDNEKVNLLLSIGVLLVTLFSSWSNGTNYSKRWHLGGFVLVIDCLLFLSTKHWTWSNSSIGISWCYLIIIAITLPVIFSLFVPKAQKSSLIRCYEKLKNRFSSIISMAPKQIQKSNSDILGFCTDNVDVNTIDHHIRQPYADLIVRKAITTESKESFAVGVTGDWGSGKTLFLNHIETSIKQEKKRNNNIMLIKFCPWESSDCRQIIVDFFNTLCDKVAPYYSKIRKPILKYAELLTMVDAPNWLVSAFKIFDWKRQLSINQLKSHISECLKKLNWKIFILIDDIDRLNDQEIYETLKLIRNTADFYNVIYIVSYDKKYLREQLTAFGIKSSNLYIEKIFPVEIKLQSPEPHFQARCLTKSIQQMTSDNYLQKTVTNIINFHEDIIGDILRTYRQVKRFARQFTLNIEALKENHVYNDIYIEDFFLLELLYYHNPELYNTLKNTPTKLLAAVNDSKYNINIFTLRSGLDGTPVKSQESFPYKGDALEEKSIDILKRIFNKNSSYRRITQLSYTESYHKYFSFGISYDQISLTELHGIINSSKDIDNQIDEWCENNKRDSLYRLLMSINLGNDSFAIKRYISTTLSFARYCTTKNIGTLFSSALKRRKYDKELREELEQYTNSEIKKYIHGFSNSQEYSLFAKGLAQLFFDEYNDYQCTGDDGYSFVGSCEKVKSLLIENVGSFLSKNPNTADNLFDASCSIYTLVIASAIALDSDEGNYFKSVIFDYLLKYFSSHKGKNKHLAESFFDVDTSDSPTEDEINDRQTTKERLLAQMFSNRDNYLIFIYNCFEK